MVRTSVPDPAFHIFSVPSAPVETIKRPWSSVATRRHRAAVAAMMRAGGARSAAWLETTLAPRASTCGSWFW